VFFLHTGSLGEGVWVVLRLAGSNIVSHIQKKVSQLLRHCRVEKDLRKVLKKLRSFKEKKFQIRQEE
jgi:hypothetical protein